MFSGFGSENSSFKSVGFDNSILVFIVGEILKAICGLCEEKMFGRKNFFMIF